jgi:hypothetical protein
MRGASLRCHTKKNHDTQPLYFPFQLLHYIDHGYDLQARVAATTTDQHASASEENEDPSIDAIQPPVRSLRIYLKVEAEHYPHNMGG